MLECNRWQPMRAEDASDERRARETFLMTDAGQKYTRELEQWRAARAAELAAEDDEVASWITMNMRDGGELRWRRLDLDKDAVIAEGTLDADSARAFVTREYLKNNCCGPGVFDLVIRAPDGSPIFMQLEVT